MPDVHPEEQPLTYESVLLNPVYSNSSSSPNKPLHETTSYAQIDIMLERMLSEVEKQEKLFGLDLDVFDSTTTSCVNELVLEPSTDALIEIPIKKPKIYETSHKIHVNENTYEFVGFGNSVTSVTPSSEKEYDLISFDDDIPRSTKVTDLDEIQESVTKLLLNVEADEAEMLLGSIEESECDSADCTYTVCFRNVKTASSESLSECSQDSWEHDILDYDYEPIRTKSNELKPFPYQRYENKPEQIWYEGAYRNLSIVPEEDEENLSLLGIKTVNKSCLSSEEYIMQQTPTSSSGDCETDTSVSRSTDDDYSEKIIRAEVKLLVKTTSAGKNEIEIRSVKDFLDSSSKTILENKSRERNRVVRSHTLPSILTSKFSNFTSKVSNILGSNKGISKSTGDVHNIINNENVETTIIKPVYTLQRLFVKASSFENEKFMSNIQNNKEQSRSRTELIATTSKRFPLQCESVDLYANTPFYPCYDKSVSPTSHLDINPFTEFITNPFQLNSQLPQAYCDWLPTEELYRGNVIKADNSVLN